MKYFEIDEPYYALIKANNKEKAIEIYTKLVVGELANDMVEVSRDYAILKFSQAPTEDKSLLPISKVIDEFNC